MHLPPLFSIIASIFQKHPRVRKISVRNSGAGNGCANFMGTWKNALFLQEKTHVHKIPGFRGGYFGFGGGGGECRFYFYRARGFSEYLIFFELIRI